jgi:hypothetical protein
VVGLLVLAGLALTATRRLRLPPLGGPVAGMQPATAAAGRLGRGGRSQRLDRPALCAWGLLLAWPVAVFAMVATYDGNGGHTHPRYLFPGLAVLAVVAALGLDGLPGARLGLWTAAVILAQLALTGAAWAGFLTALRGRRPTGPVDLAGAVARLLEASAAAQLTNLMLSGYRYASPLLALTPAMIVRISQAIAIAGSSRNPITMKIRTTLTST